MRRGEVSPVAAAIILIAVTVAVSVAVAAWMGVLSFTWMDYEYGNENDLRSCLKIVNKGVYGWTVNDLGFVRAGAEEIYDFTGLAEIRAFNGNRMVIARAEVWVSYYEKVTVHLWSNGTITASVEPFGNPFGEEII